MKYHIHIVKSAMIIGINILALYCCPVLAQYKPWVAPVHFVDLANPMPASPEKINAGKILYQTYCSPCHGTKGKGDGAAAAALNPKPADHTSPALLKETDGSLFYKISEGRTPMPKYKEAFSDEQRWALVDYIRTLNKMQKK
jgi:mono/diheme cytochrome c family protein